MDIYVLPSLTETTSLSTMEAMSCGAVPVTTPVGHLKEYIVEGKMDFCLDKAIFMTYQQKLKSFSTMKNCARK